MCEMGDYCNKVGIMETNGCINQVGANPRCICKQHYSGVKCDKRKQGEQFVTSMFAL